MGKSKIIPLVIRKSTNKEFISPWIKSQYGKPTEANLSQWRDGFNASLLKGGTNSHLTSNNRLQCKIEVFDQRSKQVVCEYNPPMFETI